MAKNYFRRYIWLIDTIRSAGGRGITFKEINEKWIDSSLNDDGEEFKLRTFRDHLRAIDEIFEIEFKCDRRDNTYHIDYESDDYGCVKKTLIDALVLNNAIQETPDLNGSIIFNDNFHQSSLPEVLRAIKDHTAICFRYQRDFSSLRKQQDKAGVSPNEQIQDIDKMVDFEPYGLYFSTVWFAVGKNLADNRIHIYTLHRMREIDFLFSTYFIPEDFNVKQYMTDFWVDDDEIEPYSGREPDDAFTLESFEAGKQLDLTL